MALAIFFLITLLFFVVRSRAILFHLLCAVLLAGFVFWTGPTLIENSPGEWIVSTMGLILYWLGLVIVRIMLTRSVSLRMLSNYAQQEQSESASEGIAGRFNDARHFGLVTAVNDGYRLTVFGRFISGIVALSYWILRIK